MKTFKQFLDKPTHTPETLAKKHGVSIEGIHAALKAGIAVEKEHTSKEDIAREIALDHLGEDPKYYEKLKKVEKVNEMEMKLQLKQIQEPPKKKKPKKPDEDYIKFDARDYWTIVERPKKK